MSNEAERVTGGCLCGSVRYEADVFLKNGYICHCTMCQRSSGQPAEIAVPIKAGTLRYTGSEPKYYAASDMGKRGFCAECGSRIVWQANNPEDDWWTNISVGSLDDPSAARATCHIFSNTKLPWFDLNEALPKFDEEDEDAMEEFVRRERNLTP